MKLTRRKSIISIIMVAVVAISGILYALADRYLIEHVEVANVNQVVATRTITTKVATATSAAGASASTTSGGSSTTNVSKVKTTATPAATSTIPSSGTVSADDWNYKSDTTTIAVKKVVTGSGNNTITYYVADVQITDATQLQNAFAKNMFGRNIIEYTSTIAKNNNAIFAINGDYYGFRSDGIIIRNGVIYRNSPTRMGLAFYVDGTMKIYDETKTSAQQLLDAGVWNTLSFGPALITNSVVATNFGTVSVDNNIGNHTIQDANPRTGIGIISPNHFVFVVVDGRSNGYSKGMTLTEFANVFKSLGCTDAYNIDGGGSSTMYFMGRVVNKPLGTGQERGTSDILFIN